MKHNRIGGTGSLTYQQQKEYWIKKAYEWAESNVPKEVKELRAGNILVNARNYGLNTLCKELGITQATRNWARKCREQRR